MTSLHVRMGDWHPVWKSATWHVFNKRCQVAGPYRTEEKAMAVKAEMESQ